MSDIIQDANPEQQAAITHGDGPLLIVAGAGTGKTKVITNRLAWLILEDKAKVHEVLALTFTEKAAQEMIERVDQLLPYGYVDLWISTFHAFADKILKRHALDIGLSNDYKLLDQTQAWLLVRKNLDKFNLDYYRPLGSPTKFIHALINHFSRCKDEGIGPKEYLNYAEEVKLNTDSSDFVKTLDLDDLEADQRQAIIKSEILRLEEVANAYHVYQQLLLDNNCLDFGDLISYCIKLFNERPIVLQKYRKQFKYLLVDEFQDNNYAQYELVKLLSAPKNNLTVVGDDDQAIFRFRGASVSNIMEFMKDYPQAKQIVLINNYRSTQAILDKAYNFIKQNDPERLEPKLKISKKLISQISTEGIIEHLHYDNGDDEVAGVIAKILQLKKQDAEVTWSDFAILVRANDTAKPYCNLFERLNIPYQFLSLRGLYNKPVILDVVNYFKLLDNYHENSAVYRALNFPFLGITNFDIAKITRYARTKTISVFEALKQATAIGGLEKEALDSLNKLIVQVEKDTIFCQKNSVSSLLIKFFNESGYNNFLKALPEAKAVEEFGYLNQFMRKIQDYEASEMEPTLKNFLQLLDYELEAGDSGSIKFDPQIGPEMVKIVSVHSAKGLEYKYVFIVNLVDRKFPCDDRKEPIEIPDALVKEKLPEGDFHLAEERRLFYVAMTRARQGLFFTSADNYGGARAKKLSRFLVELDYAKPDIAISLDKSPVLPPVAKQKPADSSKLELPKNYSFSSLSNYDTCPYKFYLGQILKIQTPKKPALTFGDIIHRTLKDFIEQSCQLARIEQADLFGAKQETAKRVLSIDELKAIYQKNWMTDGFGDAKTAELYKKKGLGLLKIFYEDFIAAPPSVHLIEQPFNYKLKGYKIIGRLDRLDKVGDSFEIIDYKTGQTKGDKLSTADRRQLTLYHVAAEEILGIRPENLTYYYLESGKRVSFQAKPKDIERIKDWLLTTIKAINQRDFKAKPNDALCSYCDFYRMCEFRKV